MISYQNISMNLTNSSPLSQRDVRVKGDLQCWCWRSKPTHTPRVNFTNILLEAFTWADPKSAERTGDLTVFFTILGSVRVKAARKMLVKSTPTLSLSLSLYHTHIHTQTNTHTHTHTQTHTHTHKDYLSVVRFALERIGH